VPNPYGRIYVTEEERAATGDRFRKHGKCGTRTYVRWTAMKQRCYDLNFKQYDDYGGRGITVCDRWNYSFENFLEDMGECPEGLTLDRIDNDGNYEPGNCRWITRQEQNLNKRAKNRCGICGEYGHNRVNHDKKTSC
jgi:hypothetical protein